MKKYCLAALVSCLLLAGSVIAEDGKPAPPDDQQRQQVLQLLQEIYRADSTPHPEGIRYYPFSDRCSWS
ncbi:hypothetical protein UC8_20530 [Roseimaritima ulvae]|uniref:Uncharacterized protein n=1 Tax=Roseimaritima ulvae TaxID=980254 RepID=A0A5B9QQ63_9BACT|nr:hypothetical protein UC8_20530 [Roseimaritima ulvae]